MFVETNYGVPDGVATPLCEPLGVYTKIDPIFCDRYVSCTYGQPLKLECPDGLAFQPFQGCKPLHEVDRGSRYRLRKFVRRIC